ncbi:response regulator transcription factor [Hippea jasoniae]|uniref:response regulator transcription factor n=1 Tax=Hippea jasoniae TaxID=944479 RepID=UPI0005511B78|nr:response regulator transcription factor [Hippea jasoniae]
MEVKVLVVEDDVDLNNTITQFLKLKEYKVYSAFDGKSALDIIFDQQIDIILMDIKLPQIDGFEVVRYIRKFKKTPIIFITSLNSEKDVEKGFEAGGDDYLRKPFSLRELELRIKAIVRRLYFNEDLIKISDNIYFDVTKFEVYKNSKRIHLKNKELLLLKLFLTNKGKILTKDEIFNEIYTSDEMPNENSLRTFVKRLRGLIGKDKIVTIKNIGYKYVG